MASSKALFLLCLNLVFFTLVTSNYVPVSVPLPSPPPPSNSGYNPEVDHNGHPDVHHDSHPDIHHFGHPDVHHFGHPDVHHVDGDHPDVHHTGNIGDHHDGHPDVLHIGNLGDHHDGDDHSGSSTPVPSTGKKCPKDVLKIQACVSVLNGLSGLAQAVVGPQRAKCCSLLDGLVGLDAGICLCTTVTADVLGLHLTVPVSVNALLNFCNKAGVPSDFECSANNY